MLTYENTSTEKHSCTRTTYALIWSDRLRPRLAYAIASVFIALAVAGLLSTASCASTEQGLQREEQLYLATSNSAASLRQIVPYVPQPASGILEGVLAVGGALLALWATHLHRSLADLRNGKPGASGSGRYGPSCEERLSTSARPNWYDKLEVDKRPQYVHRLVMSTLLGRPLRRDEHVHHVDGDKQNNRPDNLQLLSAGEHSWRTHHRHPVVAECAWCQALFRPRLSAGEDPGVLLEIVRRLPPLAPLRGRVLRQPQGRAREMRCRAGRWEATDTLSHRSSPARCSPL